MSAQRQSNWYPTRDQLDSPDKMLSAMKQVLDQHYALQDRVNAQDAKTAASSPAVPSGPPPGSGPTDTQILGLRVVPVNPSKLANGATLKYNAKKGQFEFV